MRSIFSLIFFVVFSLPVFSQEGLKNDLKKEALEYRKEGYRLQSKGDFKGALIYYQKSAAIYPQNAEIYNDIGVVYESLGNKKDALAMYKKAIEIDPNYLPAYTNLALFYESIGDIKKATKYWIARYRRGKKGEYWREKAKEKLLKLGNYKEVRKEILEDEAIDLSKDIVYKREQERLKKTEEARLHLEMSVSLFNQEDFSGALKELETALYLNPQDKELQMQISDLYVAAKRAYTKQRIKHYVDEAMAYIDKNDYLAAAKEIEQALSVISRFSR